MQADGLATDAIAPFQTRACWVIGARSYLVNRIDPEPEWIRLPGRVQQGGALSYEIRGSRFLPPVQGGWRNRLRRTISRELVSQIDDRILIDMRYHTPSNWAHFLNNHLPLYFRLSALLCLGPDQLLGILPSNAPAYVQNAAALFGLVTIVTDDVVEGNGIDYRLSYWNAIRAARHKWVSDVAVRDRLAAIDAGSRTVMPKRVFLSRRSSRRIENHEEIERILKAQGYATIYAEDLPELEQFRLIRGAQEIVAIHGAGLAPLLYRDLPAPGETPLRLIEILPCGHFTTVYAQMAQQVGVLWTGIRGRIEERYVRPAYNLGKGFTQFSLDSFTVDPMTLELALAGEGPQE